MWSTDPICSGIAPVPLQRTAGSMRRSPYRQISILQVQSSCFSTHSRVIPVSKGARNLLATWLKLPLMGRRIRATEHQGHPGVRARAISRKRGLLLTPTFPYTLNSGAVHGFEHTLRYRPGGSVRVMATAGGAPHPAPSVFVELQPRMECFGGRIKRSRPSRFPHGELSIPTLIQDR
jgi:hypothetical protein